MMRALRLLLAAALLVAWQQALVHPLAHVDEHGGLVHLAGDHDDDSPGAADPTCDAIAAVAVAIGAGQSAPEASTSGTDASVAGHDFCPASALRLAYRSQAPPQYS
jgi:hypothetical protein